MHAAHETSRRGEYLCQHHASIGKLAVSIHIFTPHTDMHEYNIYIHIYIIINIYMILVLNRISYSSASLASMHIKQCMTSSSPPVGDLELPQVNVDVPLSGVRGEGQLHHWGMEGQVQLESVG